MAAPDPVVVEEKLRALSGNMAAVGRALGVTRQAVFDYCRRRPKLQAVARECREVMLDDVEGALQRAALAGEAWAVCFYLKTQGKARGYVERQEVTGADGDQLVPIEAVVASLQRAKRNGRADTGGGAEGNGRGGGPLPG